MVLTELGFINYILSEDALVLTELVYIKVASRNLCICFICSTRSCHMRIRF